jgi:hypothetical protein
MRELQDQILEIQADRLSIMFYFSFQVVSNNARV